MNDAVRAVPKPAKGSGEKLRRKARAERRREYRPCTEAGERVCWLCGRNGCVEPLDKHHIFGGGLREKSEALGAVVYLCHGSCHESGPEAAHRSRETADKLHRWAQEKVMREQNWTTEDFIREFGRNYL